jgi:hypothetical protein
MSQYGYPRVYPVRGDRDRRDSDLDAIRDIHGIYPVELGSEYKRENVIIDEITKRMVLHTSSITRKFEESMERIEKSIADFEKRMTEHHLELQKRINILTNSVEKMDLFSEMTKELKAMETESKATKDEKSNK